jgi:glycosyltransferase involved in cell wall biosynthesis
MLPQLVRRGHSVKVILASAGRLDQSAYEIDGVCVEPLKAKFLERYANRFERWSGLDIFYYMLPVAWAAWAQAHEGFDYDVVEVTDWALLFLPWVAAEKRAPVVVSLHGSCGQVDWFGKAEPRSLDGDWVRMVEAVALRGADVVHANSRANAEFWREKTGRDILVIPPAYGGGTRADLTTIEHRGWRDKEQPQVGPKGERVGASESKDTEVTETAVGPCLDKPSGALFSNPFTSELARDSENISPTRSAIGPAGAAEPLRADAGGLVSDGSEFPKSLDSRPPSLDLSSPATSHSPPATAPQALKGLVVGRLQNYKGADLLCKALRLVPGIEIEWVGGDTDWGQSGIKANEYLAANYPDVFGTRLRWLGRLDREEVDKKIESAAFLVAPSFLDVFNLTVAEGMEAGLPVICSRAAGAEMLIEHGKSGLLFDPAKPDELAACLNRIVEMSAVDRNEMGHKAQEAVKALLSEERILNLLEGSYKEAIEKGTPQRIDEWLESLLSPGAGLKAPSQVGFARWGLRKFGRMLTKI